MPRLLCLCLGTTLATIVTACACTICRIDVIVTIASSRMTVRRRRRNWLGSLLRPLRLLTADALQRTKRRAAERRALADRGVGATQRVLVAAHRRLVTDIPLPLQLMAGGTGISLVASLEVILGNQDPGLEGLGLVHLANHPHREALTGLADRLAVLPVPGRHPLRLALGRDSACLTTRRRSSLAGSILIAIMRAVSSRTGL